MYRNNQFDLRLGCVRTMRLIEGHLIVIKWDNDDEPMDFMDLGPPNFQAKLFVLESGDIYGCLRQWSSKAGHLKKLCMHIYIYICINVI